MDVITDFSDQQRWDAYVQAHPESRFCHLSAYRCLKEVYGYTPCYFGFQKQERLVGVLPAFETSSMFFGRRLISQPFSEYGGFLLDPDLDGSDFQEIIQHLKTFLAKRQLRGLEMHGRSGVAIQDLPDSLTKSNDQSLAYLPLDRPVDELWNKVITYQVRKAVQKAERSDVEVIERSDEDTIVRDFYPLYLSSMKRLGVPPHGIQYYLRCRAAFGDGMKIFWALHKGRPISGLLGFSCGKRVSIINIVSDESFWEIRPNDLIHWEYIKWAHAAGFQYFDFGSIRYEGQLRYKKKWGCTITDHGYYHLGGAKSKEAAPSQSFDSSSGTMKRFSDLWAKYVPEAVGRVVGPVLRKNLVR